MKTSKDKCSVTALILTFVGVLFVGVVIVAGILFFNGKTIVVPDDELTIQDAVDAAVEGDIILVKASGGPYEENVVIDKEGLKLIGIEKEKPVLDGTVVGGSGIIIQSTSGVLIKNFIVQNFSSVRGIFLNSSNNNMIKENIVKNNEVGIRLSDSDSNTIKGNTANENDLDGILLTRSNSNMIKGNTLNRNERDGILLSDSDSNMIKGNKTNDNDDDGILLDADSNDNDVFFNRAFGNGLDINDLNITPPLNNFKGNKCGISNPPEICN